ncbi:hypothetical protein [Saccharopolyspora phatthalungensis]|uniref:Uncharacterized protein n=1 Tax=Saccharopolyspora phatthalungensis TaxID=664693 RepID=A0A840PY72_9PSEU|nr:hypothetical protein [Saccharopolyspora phatthalungensis]MBB5152904.1 hypothetical protein [Saccharopolyspora phatthalungensis]
MRSWLKWGLPLAIVVLLGAAGGGMLLAQYVYRDPSSQPLDQTSPPAVQTVKSALGIIYTPDAAAHPDRQTVQLLLDDHFRSINMKSYDLWKSTVVPAKWRELPREKWFDNYGTTRDFDWTVQRIDPAPDKSLLVLLTFRSNQAKEDAPPELPETCVTWNVAYPVVVDPETGNGLRLDTSKLPNSALFRRCQQ